MGTIRIIGIDPGLRRTGWGVIDYDGVRLGFVACGSVVSDGGESLGVRLRQLFDGLQEVLERLAPAEAAVEQTFVNRDAAATLKLGQARGIALLVPALLTLPIAEYAPNAVKKTVVGAGHADKVQIRAMVSRLLPRAAFDSTDAADALAIAITHAHCRSYRALEASAMAARWSAAMIGKLTGRLDEIAHGAVIIDVGGVGYEVTVGARTLSRLPAIGESVSLAIDTHMREDAIKLYGFATEHERAWFRALQTVQGVGAKVALAVLGILDAERPRQCRGAPGQGAGRPRAGGRAEGRRAHRRRAQGQDAGARARHPAGAGHRRSRPVAGGRFGAGRGIGADQSRLCPRSGFRRDLARGRQGRTRGPHRGADPLGA